MKILVTGGAGYIGTHAVVELLNKGYEVVVVDNFSNSESEALIRVKKITGKDFQVYPINLLNQQDLESVFADNEINAVIHFAGYKSVGESVVDPLKYYFNNISGTLILCNIMKRYKVKKMIFSSSATVYGKQTVNPITEDSPLQATNPYGRTKLMIEEILRDLYLSDENWSISILRYFNPIGAHSSGEIGEEPNGIPNNLMPFITNVAIGKLKELKIFGNDYPTIDGTGVRDYIHVVDLAKGHLKALEHTLKKGGVNSYNLGTGNGYSVLEVVSAFENVSNIKIPYSFSQRRPGDVAICYADPTKAKEDLNWHPTKGLEEMCADSWKWQTLNPHSYKQFINIYK